MSEILRNTYAGKVNQINGSFAVNNAPRRLSGTHFLRLSSETIH